MHKYIDPISCYLFAFLCVQYPNPKHKNQWHFIHWRFLRGIMTGYPRFQWQQNSSSTQKSHEFQVSLPRQSQKSRYHCLSTQTLHTLFSNYFQRTGGLLLFCTVFRAQWLIELIFYSFRFDKASTYSCWIVYISMSFIGDSYVRNLVHEMVITLISIYTKEFVCIVNNQNIHWDGYTAQWFNGFIRVFHCWSNWGNTSRFIISW